MKKNIRIRWFLCLTPTLFGMIMGCPPGLLTDWLHELHAPRVAVADGRVNIPLATGFAAGFLPGITGLFAGDSFPLPFSGD